MEGKVRKSNVRRLIKIGLGLVRLTQQFRSESFGT